MIVVNRDDAPAGTYATISTANILFKCGCCAFVDKPAKCPEAPDQGFTCQADNRADGQEVIFIAKEHWN